MPVHIDPNDPKYGHAAAAILRRHDNFEPEANITSAVRDFLILTGLAKSEEMVEENPPAEASRRAVDLTALDTFIEFKRRIGTTSGGEPDPENVQQLDDYLAQSASQGRVRMGRPNRRQAMAAALARSRRCPFGPPVCLHPGGGRMGGFPSTSGCGIRR